MDHVQLAIVGCGGMGGRHLLGLQELQASGMSNVHLLAVCDLRQDNAEHLADDAGRRLGRRPAVFTDLARMAAAFPQLQAVAITTDAGSHHRVACAAFERGLHVLCEKPLALTLRACNRILTSWQRSGKVLSVAENYRRDPVVRLTRSLLERGLIGEPYALFDIGASGSDRIIILPWRHDKQVGGILLDGGVHNADLMQYYLGAVRQVYAQARLYEPVRYKSSSPGGVSPFYARWQAEIPADIKATAEDALIAVLTFESGVLGQWTSFYAAHGEGFGRQVIYGRQGSLQPGSARSGHGPRLHLDGVGEIRGEALLELLPDFHLDAITARLFGAERMAGYAVPFEEADRKLLAIEYYEFAACVQQGQAPEVDGYVGRQALAIVYAALESSRLGRVVTVAEVETEAVAAYQAEINAHLGL
jgi:predicted dehydrogenase